MKKENKDRNFTKAFKSELEHLEAILKDKNKITDTSILNDIYSTVHKIDETAIQLGINTLMGLLSPVEVTLSNITKNKGALESKHTSVILAAIHLIYNLLKDPSLETPAVKSGYDSITKEIAQTFENSENEDEGYFSNNKFQEVFIDEAYELINQLEEKLLQLESDKEDQTLIDNVFRIMHTLKGNSNMFGFAHLADITHHLENVYDEIRAGRIKIDHQILDNTLQCIDHFRNLIEDPELNDASNKVIQESIINDITDILETSTTSGSPIASPKMEDDKKNKEVEEELSIFYIYFKPHTSIFDDGTNPLYFVYDLFDLGDCKTRSHVKFPKKIDAQKCYTSWHILLNTKESKDAILDNFVFLSDNSMPIVEAINKGKFESLPNLVDKFNDIENLSESFASLLIDVKDVPTNKSDKKTQAVKVKNNESSISSIRVASAKVDLMMNLISELVTKQAELSMIAGNNEITQLQEVAESIESISRDLRDNAFSISLIPLEKSVLRFQRLVRDVSSKFNKKVNFNVEGKETELDKTIIEKIIDPIMHILRNSIDHGIEDPETRKKLGKPETGNITLKAFPSGAHVIIEISDDGGGINVDMVRNAAIKKGYINENDDFTTDDMIKLILSPGFSTTENISEVSGRGVGMDVVRQKINEIRGELDIQTVAGVGTTLTIKLPLTISIIDSLLVMLGKTYYLIPLGVVERCAEVPTSAITELKTNYMNLEGEYIPIIDLHKEFDIEEDRDDYQRLILVDYKGMLVALVVDQIVGNHQAVLKSLGQVYRKQEFISGASILGNGGVALVVDTNRLVHDYMEMREDEINKMNLLNMQVK